MNGWSSTVAGADPVPEETSATELSAESPPLPQADRVSAATAANAAASTFFLLCMELSS